MTNVESELPSIAQRLRCIARALRERAVIDTRFADELERVAWSSDVAGPVDELVERYPLGLTDAEWAKEKPLLPGARA